MELLDAMENMTMNINLVSGSLGLVAYFLSAWALYTMAERRGIKKPWLAWIPFGKEWILGSLADQYRYVVNGEVKNKRKVLLWLDIAISAIASLFFVLFIWMVIEYLLAAGSLMAGWISFFGETDPSLVMPMEMPGIGADTVLFLAVLMILLVIPMLVLAIIRTVWFYKALYDVFRSCEPNNGMLYLVISIVTGLYVGGIEAIFLVICRDKDLGMPPRKTEVTQEPVVLTEPSAEPQENPDEQ